MFFWTDGIDSPTRDSDWFLAYRGAKFSVIRNVLYVGLMGTDDQAPTPSIHRIIKRVNGASVTEIRIILATRRGARVAGKA